MRNNSKVGKFIFLMWTLLIIFSSFLLLTQFSAAKNSKNRMETATIFVDASQCFEGKISPFIYGNFIEFSNILGGDCVDGLWAQMVQNRGFEDVDIDNDGVSDPWRPIGSDAIYSMDSECCFNSKYSQKIELKQPGKGGIYFYPISIKKGENYAVSLWLKGTNIYTVTVSMEDVAGTVKYASHFIRGVMNEWRKYTFNLIPNVADEIAIFKIEFFEKGALWIDQVSLMPKTAIYGFRKNVLKMICDLKPNILRFPGGCFADSYHWKDGIGERDKRPTVWNQAWGGWETNEVGTDEFIQLCRLANSEPQICVNFGSGSPQEAADWVEYCNGSTETKFGAIRADNGHREPYKVKYWEIGNEIYGPWEIGHCDVETYAKRYLEFYRAMKAVDPDIKIIAVGGDGNDLNLSWLKKFLALVGSEVDYVSLHCYAPLIGDSSPPSQELYKSVVAAPLKYERVFSAAKSSIGKILKGRKDIKLAVTEWNTMYQNTKCREQTLEAAIFVAGMLNVFIRNSDVVEICNFSELVGGWEGASIRIENGNVYGTPSYFVMKMYSNLEADRVVKISVVSNTFDTEEIGNVPSMEKVPYLDGVACLSADRRQLHLIVINRHPSKDIIARINISGYRVRTQGEVQVVNASPNALGIVEEITSVTNYPELPDLVFLRASTVSNVGSHFIYTFSAHSVTTISLSQESLTR